jgi:alkylation response protein AidB-like acyl-CoA dehydrogenase
MFTLSPTQERTRLICEYVKTAERDGKPLREDAVVRQKIAQLVTDTAVARGLSMRFLSAATTTGKPPTSESSQYKLFTTQLSQRACNVALDIMGPAGQIRVDTEDAPLGGRFEGAYRATVVETIGGGASEIQKNIIARRKLGLPKNF